MFTDMLQVLQPQRQVYKRQTAHKNTDAYKFF